MQNIEDLFLKSSDYRKVVRQLSLSCKQHIFLLTESYFSTPSSYRFSMNTRQIDLRINMHVRMWQVIIVRRSEFIQHIHTYPHNRWFTLRWRLQNFIIIESCKFRFMWFNSVTTPLRTAVLKQTAMSTPKGLLHNFRQKYKLIYKLNITGFNVNIYKFKINIIVGKCFCITSAIPRGGEC